jgi:hypothetical protein
MPTLAPKYPNRSSEAADRGTMAHECLELCLKNNYNAEKHLGGKWQNEDGKTYTMEQEDCDAVQEALDFIRSEIDEGDEWETETKLKYNDNLWGTCDFSRYRPSDGELLVVDYKHGSGIPVEAYQNPQGGIYALMKAKSLGNRGLSSIRFVIVQPRCPHSAGPIREYVIDAVDFLDFESDIVDAMKTIETAARHSTFDQVPEHDWNETYLVRGDHCRWCPANFAGGCPFVQRDLDRAAELDFSTDTISYDPKDVADALAVCDRAEAAIKATRAFAYGESMNGVSIPLWKLVDKRPTEKWSNENGVKSRLAKTYELTDDDLYKPQALKTPAQLRTALEPLMDGSTKKERTFAAKQVLSEFTQKISSGTVLVPEGDPRPPAKSNPAADFEPIE